MNNDDNQIVNLTPQLSIAESQERANIDMLIATAKRYPRDLQQVKRRMEAMACLDEETAESCNYHLERQGKVIEGPSVRMAEIAVACYQNIRCGGRVSSNDGKTVTGQGYCHDLENTTFVAWETPRRITDKNGRIYSEDMQVTTGNAAAAIAFRNAIFKVIPLSLIKPVAEKAKQIAVGDLKTLTQRRTRALKKFASIGVREDRVLAFLGRASADQIDITDVEKLFGIFTAIKEQSTTIEEQFPKTPEIKKPEMPPPATAAAPIPPDQAMARVAEMKEAVRRADPVPAPAPTAQEEVGQNKQSTVGPSTAELVRDKLSQTVFTVNDFLGVLRKNALATKETSIDQVDEDNLKTALANWDGVMDQMEEMVV
jgi:hypothetical protein